MEKVSWQHTAQKQGKKWLEKVGGGGGRPLEITSSHPIYTENALRCFGFSTIQNYFIKIKEWFTYQGTERNTEEYPTSVILKN